MIFDPRRHSESTPQGPEKVVTGGIEEGKELVWAWCTDMPFIVWVLYDRKGKLLLIVLALMLLLDLRGRLEEIGKHILVLAQTSSSNGSSEYVYCGSWCS